VKKFTALTFAACTLFLAGCCTAHRAQPIGSANVAQLPTVTPNTEEIRAAEQIAKPYVYRVLSQPNPPSFQTAEVRSLTIGVASQIPDDFTIGSDRKVLYSHYRQKFLRFTKDDHRCLVISYYDPVFFPDWEKINGMMGGFSAYFTVTVDLTDGKVVEHYASPM